MNFKYDSCLKSCVILIKFVACTTSAELFDDDVLVERECMVLVLLPPPPLETVVVAAAAVDPPQAEDELIANDMFGDKRLVKSVAVVVVVVSLWLVLLMFWLFNKWRGVRSLTSMLIKDSGSISLTELNGTKQS